MEFLSYLAASKVSDWLLVSMWGFPTLIALHSVGMGVVVGIAFTTALQLNGIVAPFSEETMPKLLTVGIWGFTLNFLTGVTIFITRAPEYIVNVTFLVKMLLVIIGAVILVLLRQRLVSHEPVVAGVDRVARRMSVVGATSWFAAVVAGRLIAYLSNLY